MALAHGIIPPPPRREIYHVPDPLRRPTRHRALLHDDGPGSGPPGHLVGGGVERGHVGGPPGTPAQHLGGRVDGEEDEIRFGDAGVGIPGEDQIGRPGGLGLRGRLVARPGHGSGAIPGHPDHIIESGLMDGQVWGVPLPDATRVLVHHLDADGGIVQGNDGRRGSP